MSEVTSYGCGTCSSSTYCGDGICNGTETYSTCPGDCPSDPYSCEPSECGTSGGSCYCDSYCVTAGDCCWNACSVCGYC